MDYNYDKIIAGFIKLFLVGSLTYSAILILIIYLTFSIWYNIRKTKQNSDLLLKLRLKRISMTTGQNITEIKKDLIRFKSPNQ